MESGTDNRIDNVMSPEFVAKKPWNAPSWFKVVLIAGLILHATFFISLRTGWWDHYFHAGYKRTTQAVDFFAVYVAGEELRGWRTIYPLLWKLEGGKNIYLPVRDTFEAKGYPKGFTPFRYLPSSAIMIAALTFVEPWTAYWIWICFYEILFFASIYLFGRRFGFGKPIYIAASMYLFFFPWYPELFIGQLSFLQSFLILGMLIASDAGDLAYAGRWWIVSVLWKQNTAICLPAFIRWGRWHTVIWLIIFLLLTCVPYFAIHPKDLAKFMSLNFRPLEYAYSGNFGFQGLIAKLLVNVGDGEVSTLRVVLHDVTRVLFICLSLGATILARKDRFTECLCLWVATFFLVFFDTWEHHLVMLLPIMVYLYLKRPGIAIWIIWFVLAMPSTYRVLYPMFAYARENGIAVNGPGSEHFWNVWHYTMIKPMAQLALYIYLLYWNVRRDRNDNR